MDPNMVQRSIVFDLQQKTPAEMLELLQAYQAAININIISSVTDQSGTIIYANDRFCEISKYDRSELMGQNHRIVNSGHHSKEFFEEMWSTITSGKPWNGEIRNRAKDGTFYWVDTVILPVQSIVGAETIQYLSLRTLITEKKIAEEQRKEYVQKLNEMLHMTSHRVRAPLARCLGLVGLVESGKMTEEEEFPLIIQHLKTSALELDSFTQELTDFMNELEKKYKEVIANYSR